MKLARLLICVLCFIVKLPNCYSQGSCKADLQLSGGHCCLLENCCVEASGGFPRCCCEQACFTYNDCCLDILDIGCQPQMGQKIPDFCKIYPDLFSTCASQNITGGCCVGDSCSVNSPSGPCCYCDKDCHLSSRQDCCTDIETIGCACNNTCAAHNFLPGCCEDSKDNCHTECTNHCFCDRECHNRGDCCSDIESIGCNPHPIFCSYESLNGINWPKSFANRLVNVSCAAGKIGYYFRYCNSQGVWDNTIINTCKSVTLQIDEDLIFQILNDSITLSSEEQLEVVSNVIKNATDISAIIETPMFPEEVITINKILGGSLTILLNNLPMDSNTTQVLQSGIIEVINNLLDTRYQNRWVQLKNNDYGSSQLLYNIELYSQYSGRFVIIKTNNQENHVEVKENIKLFINTTNKDFVFSSHVTDYVDREGAVQAFLQSNQLINQGNGSGSVVVNIVINNIGDFLKATTKSNVEAGSNVISSQVVSYEGAIPFGIVLNFTTKIFENANVTSPRCVFWNYTAGPDGKGDWSDEGIEIINVSKRSTGSVEENNTLVQYTIVCNSSHLTPFVVLVDAHGVLEQIPPEEALALEIFSYIGVSISSICLILTIVFLLMLGKKLVIDVQFFIHFNLCVALLSGYLIYLFFIDDKLINVTHSKAGCAVIAGFLHYFFLATFSWILCEGIMLFLLLVIVFSKISKRWYLFLIIGWGLPVIPVTISAGVIHDAYGVHGKFCWLDPNKRGAVWAFVGPMIGFILVNIIFLILSLRGLIRYHSRTLKNKGEKKIGYAVFKKTILGTLALIPLLGVTWLIGVFLVNTQTTIFAWLFVVFACSQGILIFLLNIVRNEKIKQTVVRKCCPCLAPKKKTETNSKVYQRGTLMRGRQHSQRGSTHLTSLDRDTSFQFSTLDKKKSLNDWNRDSMVDMPPPIMNIEGNNKND